MKKMALSPEIFDYIHLKSLVFGGVYPNFSDMNGVPGCLISLYASLGDTAPTSQILPFEISDDYVRKIQERKGLSYTTRVDFIDVALEMGIDITDSN